MAKRGGLGQRFFVGGYNLSGDIGSFQRVAGGNSPLVVTGIDKSAFERIGGKRDGGIDWSAWFNDAAGQAHPVLSALPRADVVASLLTGTTAGMPVASMVAKQLNYDGTRNEDGSFPLTVQSLANGFGLDWGVLLTAGLRQDTAATNGAALDFGAVQGGAYGAQLFVHLNAFTGTSVTIKVQSSSDNGVGDAWADVAGLTTGALVAAPQAARIAYTGAALERYLRVVTTGTFTVADFVVGITVNDTVVTF